MKFYDREDELGVLKKADALKEQRGVMSLLYGRRRVGKTALTLQEYSSTPKIYLFVSKKDEKLLSQEYIEEIKRSIDVPIFGEISRFEDIFAMLLEYSRTNPLTIIIDEFQEFMSINSSIYSSMQKLWDLNRNISKMHLILCGSVYSLMKKIIEDAHEPLFGRADFKLHLQPFKVAILKEILKDNSALTPNNLLDFYMLTGGIAKYTELFTLHGAFDRVSMVDVMIQENSLFLDEGKNRVIEEFGKEYGTYFSILSLIANSKTSKSEIEGVLDRNVSGYLYRLENDYNIIKSIKPINAKEGSKVQKYAIVDNFLYFWFRFIYKYQSLIEAENFERLKEIILRDFDTFSGRFLEKLFMELFKEEKRYTNIGSYWERGNKNEIDIVAIDEIERKLLICEVKLSKKRLSGDALVLKSQKLAKEYEGYDIEYRLLSLEDLMKK